MCVCGGGGGQWLQMTGALLRDNSVPEEFELRISRSGPEVLNFFSCSTQLSLKSILLINFKMPTIVSRIDYQFLRLEPEFFTSVS